MSIRESDHIGRAGAAYSATIWMRRQRQSGWQCAVAVLR
jgi:hypothetical protein